MEKLIKGLYFEYSPTRFITMTPTQLSFVTSLVKQNILSMTSVISIWSLPSEAEGFDLHIFLPFPLNICSN